jgi:hypothetical protein
MKTRKKAKLKVRKDVLFMRTEDGGLYMDRKYVDLYDVFLYEGVEHMIIGYGMCDAKDELLALKNGVTGREKIGIPISIIRDKVAEFKADDKFIAYVTHEDYGTPTPKVFDIATGREPYPIRFETSWNKIVNKTIS